MRPQLEKPLRDRKQLVNEDTRATSTALELPATAGKMPTIKVEPVGHVNLCNHIGAHHEYFHYLPEAAQTSLLTCTRTHKVRLSRFTGLLTAVTAILHCSATIHHTLRNKIKGTPVIERNGTKIAATHKDSLQYALTSWSGSST